EVAGVCGTANWVCVAECIDAGCVDNCLRKGCETALSRLQRCTENAGCAPDDTTCSARTCGNTCQKAFEPAPPSPEKERAAPCDGFTPEAGFQLPKGLVGTWVLSAATLQPEPKGTPGRLNPQPRADYARSLEVTPEGCFLLRTSLEDATLGRGNALEVRAWGSFVMEGEDRVKLMPKDGQAVGPVCGKPRVIPLSKGKFLGPRYKVVVEKDVLTLIIDDKNQRTFQFQRAKPEDAPEPAPAQP
ncbi:MAG TPA: hypothetical protein VF815_30715, partial [Myxococcaceae bacterium]